LSGKKKKIEVRKRGGGRLVKRKGVKSTNGPQSRELLVETRSKKKEMKKEEAVGENREKTGGALVGTQKKWVKKTQKSLGSEITSRNKRKPPAEHDQKKRGINVVNLKKR